MIQHSKVLLTLFVILLTSTASSCLKSGSWSGFLESDKPVAWKITSIEGARSAIWESGHQMRNSFVVVGREDDPESEHLREWWSKRKVPSKALFIYIEVDPKEAHQSIRDELSISLNHSIPKTLPFGFALQPYEKDDPHYSMCGPRVEYEMLTQCVGIKQCGPHMARWLAKVN